MSLLGSFLSEESKLNFCLNSLKLKILSFSYRSKILLMLLSAQNLKPRSSVPDRSFCSLRQVKTVIGEHFHEENLAPCALSVSPTKGFAVCSFRVAKSAEKRWRYFRSCGFLPSWSTAAVTDVQTSMRLLLVRQPNSFPGGEGAVTTSVICESSKVNNVYCRALTSYHIIIIGDIVSKFELKHRFRLSGANAPHETQTWWSNFTSHEVPSLSG